MLTHEIRRRFTEHFVSQGHTDVPSASLIVDDPNLLFVNAGMVPFVPFFLGQQTPVSSRATSIQKCVRTLDIEEVGITTRHNTFFQMAGNFSFGDYFKKDAISLAWSLLTNPQSEGGYGIDPDRLWVTVYHDDDEAEQIWREEVGVPADRIQRRGMKDNYWSMGIPGPCGPCSEIFYDRGEAYGVQGGPEADEDRYIEIWNLVFMQNERGAGQGKDSFDILGPLPKKNIDTGMGIERVAFLLQGVDNVYETDLLRPTIAAAEKLSGTRYGAVDKDDIRFRVIADHARTAYMLISDGVTPGNDGRGYVLRRLLRRIVRSARLLGAQGAVMNTFMTCVNEAMGPSYPEAAENFDRISRVAVAEENAFLKTLESGTKLFDSAVTKIADDGGKILAGAQAFELHDTHGFPIDLTVEMAAEVGLSVDHDTFVELMQQQRDRAKADSMAKKLAHTDMAVYKEFLDQGDTQFVGYTDLNVTSRVIGVINDGVSVPVASVGDEVEIVLRTTTFYAESGGQIGDQGVIVTSSGSARIVDVQKVAKKLWVHKARVTEGEITVDQPADVKVDAQWRRTACQAHTATHLVHAALREILGPEATQAGSMNKPGYMRFDFSWTDGLSDDVRHQIEHAANEAVDRNFEVVTTVEGLQSAKDRGAMALFGENYSDEVRVVEVNDTWSMELCGGTHVARTAEIGLVSVVGESSVGSGIRRIEAVVGMDGYKQASSERALLSTISTALKAKAEDTPDRVFAMMDRLKAAEKEIERLKAQSLGVHAAELVTGAREVNGVQLISAIAPDAVTAKALRGFMTDIKNRVSGRPAVILVAVNDGGKVPFSVAVTDAAQEKGLQAGKILQQIGSHLGGRGGGKADMAQGSGTTIDGFDAAQANLVSIVENL